MGVVYEALDRATDEPVALKMLRPEVATPTLIKHEFRTLADVLHPNVVQLYDLFEARDALCLTMELVPGSDLISALDGIAMGATVTSSALRTATQLPLAATQAQASPRSDPSRGGADPALVSDRFAQLARGLYALHRRRIVHRDVKPQNVRVTPEGRVVILDFGIAAPVGARAAVAGTVAYMAPEQADGAAPDPSADWYSFGILLYEALAGRLPWRGDPASVLRRKRMDAAPSLHGQVAAPVGLVELIDALLQRDPAERPTAREVLERLSQRRQPRAERASSSRIASPSSLRAIVGRTTELTQLTAAWAAVAEGTSAWFAVEGPSGIGKTALVTELAATIATGGSGVVLAGRCYEREAIAYKGIDQIVAELVIQLVQRGASPSPEGSILARTFPVALDLSDTSPERPVPEGRHHCGAALRSCLERLATHAPLLIVLDDIQWADRDCLGLIQQALAPPGIPGVMVVATARPGALAGWRELPIPFTPVRLAALDEAASVELVRQLVGGAIDRVDAAELARRSDGHPFDIIDQVSVALGDLATPRRGGDDPIVVRRIEVAPPDVRDVTERVCVVGAPVAAAAIERAAAAAGTRDPTSAIERAQLAGLVRCRRMRGRIVVEPAHDRVREEVVSRLSDAQRRDHAAELAPILEQAGHEAGEVAALYVLAGRPDSARRCARTAAERMSSIGGHDVAAALWSQVASWSSGGERRDAERRAADAFSLAGRGSDAAAMYRALSSSSSNEGERRQLLRRTAEELLRVGRISEGNALIADGLAAEPRGTVSTLVRAVAAHAATRAGWLPSKAADATPDHEHLELLYVAMLGHALGSPGQFLYSIERFLRAALRSGEPRFVTLGWCAQATTACWLGHTMFAQTALHRAAAAHVDCEDLRSGAIVVSTSALLELSVGAWGRADQLGEQAAEMMDRVPRMSWERNTMTVFCTASSFYRGDLRRLAAIVRRERERMIACGDLYAHEILHSGFAVLPELLENQPQRATETLNDLPQQPGVWNAILRVSAHGFVGCYEGGPRSHRERADRLLGTASLPFVRSPVMHGSMLWTRCAQEIAANGDRRAIGRWIAELRSLRDRGMSAIAELLAGHAALLDDDRTSARQHGAAAHIALQAEDMQMLAWSARWLVDPDVWPEWRDQLARAGAAVPERFARIYAPSLRIAAGR